MNHSLPKFLKEKLPWIALPFVVSAMFAVPVQGSDLTVLFEERNGGVRITIETWVVPEGLSLNTPFTNQSGVFYTASNTGSDIGISIKNSNVAIPVPPGYYVFPLGLELSDENGGILDFSKLELVSPVAASSGNIGGIKLVKFDWEDNARAVIAFNAYDADTRTATFGVDLWLADVSFADLFVDNAFSEGAFSVWTSDAFSVRFDSVPEPSSIALMFGVGGILLMGYLSRKHMSARKNNPTIA